MKLYKQARKHPEVAAECLLALWRRDGDADAEEVAALMVAEFFAIARGLAGVKD